MPLVAAFGADSAPDAERRAALVLLGVTLPTGTLREIMLLALEDPRARAFLDVHESGGVVWLRKERFEELAAWLGERETIDGRASFALARRESEDLARIAANAGYQVERIRLSLGERKPAPSPPKRAAT
jgi:hypothetical protein